MNFRLTYSCSFMSCTELLIRCLIAGFRLD